MVDLNNIEINFRIAVRSKDWQPLDIKKHFSRIISQNVAYLKVNNPDVDLDGDLNDTEDEFSNDEYDYYTLYYMRGRDINHIGEFQLKDPDGWLIVTSDGTFDGFIECLEAAVLEDADAI